MCSELSKFLNAVDTDNYRTIRNSEFGDDLAYADILQICMIEAKGKLTIGELGEMMNLSKPAITQKVNDLVRRGIVEKIQSDTDKRFTYLQLTKRFHDNCTDSKVLNLRNEIEKGFTSDEQIVFYKILDHLTKYLID